MDLTFQVPMQYCSLQHWTLLLSPVTSTTGYCILSPYLFNLHAESIRPNAGLEEGSARTKIAERNINNLRYADDTTPMAEREEELKCLLMKVKEESEEAGLKLNSEN